MRQGKTRRIALGGMLAALASVLMFLEFSVPLVPSFLKLDLSEIPAMIGACALGPVGGILISLVKNLLHLPFTNSGGVGELANFLLSAACVLPVGLIYRLRRDRVGVILGVLAGTAAMSLVSLPVNYYITYPFYTVFMDMDVILGMYREFIPGIRGLWDALLRVNVPFTIVKGLLSGLACILVYRPIERYLRR